MTKTNREERMEERHLARCGMNCALCGVYQRSGKACPGCNGDAAGKPKHCIACAIKVCEKGAGALGCPECAAFPCKRLLQMDARYRKQYGYSTRQTLERIRERGIEHTLVDMRESWACPNCGGLLCVHDKACPACGIARGEKPR